jgi:hypothetical protein
MSKEYRDKLKSVGYLKGGQTKPRVEEYKRPDGVAVKATTDELGNTVTEHNTPDDRVDVMIRPDTAYSKMKVN